MYESLYTIVNTFSRVGRERIILSCPSVHTYSTSAVCTMETSANMTTHLIHYTLPHKVDMNIHEICNIQTHNYLEISYICTSTAPTSRVYCLHLTQMYIHPYLFLYPATLMMNVSVKETASQNCLRTNITDKQTNL